MLAPGPPLSVTTSLLHRRHDLSRFCAGLSPQHKSVVSPSAIQSSVPDRTAVEGCITAAFPCLPWCACHSSALPVGWCIPSSPVSYPLGKLPPVRSSGQGVEMCFWLLKLRAKLVSQDLTPSSAVSRSLGGWRSFLRVQSLSSTRDGTPTPLPSAGPAATPWHLLHSLSSEDAWVQR